MNGDEISDIKRIIDQFKKALPKLTIYILGPGQFNKNEYARECYGKRCQIKDALKDEHEVFFPEQVANAAKSVGFKISNQLMFEIVTMKEEDINLIIMIFVTNASGLQTELEAFSQHPKLAEKMWVFYDTTYYTKGENRFWYINDALDLIDGHKGRILPFTKNDIEKCSLVAKIKELVEQYKRALYYSIYKKY